MRHESIEQCAVIEWSLFFDELTWLHASLNGAFLQGDKKQRAIQAGRLKKEGMKNGVYDLFLPKARHGFHGLYIEMKRADGKGKRSPDQKSFGSAMSAEGYCAVVCHGSDEAIDVISHYMEFGGKRWNTGDKS